MSYDPKNDWKLYFCCSHLTRAKVIDWITIAMTRYCKPKANRMTFSKLWGWSSLRHSLGHIRSNHYALFALCSERASELKSHQSMTSFANEIKRLICTKNQIWKSPFIPECLQRPISGCASIPHWSAWKTWPVCRMKSRMTTVHRRHRAFSFTKEINAEFAL